MVKARGTLLGPCCRPHGKLWVLVSSLLEHFRYAHLNIPGMTTPVILAGYRAGEENYSMQILWGLSLSLSINKKKN